MKIVTKSLSIVCTLVLILTLFSINAKESSASEYDELNVGVDSELAEGEEVVDTFTELVLDDELIGKEVPFEEETSPFVITPPSKDFDVVYPLERSLMWYGTSSTYQGLSYSSWYFAGASTISGGSLSASHTKTVAHRYSGTLKIPVRSLESVVGFDVTASWAKTVSYRSKTYDSGRYRLEYRHVYKKYKVKQEQKYDRRGKTYDTRYVYPQKWVERQYRVVKF
jgi:hypothetical protein